MNLSIFHQGFGYDNRGVQQGSQDLWYSYWNGKKWDQDAKVQNVGMSDSPSAVEF
jgi:hypothetical protein